MNLIDIHILSIYTKLVKHYDIGRYLIFHQNYVDLTKQRDVKIKINFLASKV